MSTRKKIFFIIVCAFGTLFFFVFLISKTVLLQGFAQIEHQETQKNIDRANEALYDRVDNLATKIYDWSSWDDTYQFIQDHNAAYVTSNLNNSSLVDLDINLMAFIDNEGKVVFSKFVDIPGGTERTISIDLLPYFSKTNKLLSLPDVDSVQKGIILLSEGPMLIVARPITKSDHAGPIQGVVIFGRLLDKSVIDHLSEIIHLPVVFTRLDHKLPLDYDKGVVPIDNETIAGYRIISDITGKKPILLMQITEDRSIFKQGEKTILSYLVIIGITGSVDSILFFIIISQRVKKLEEAKLKDEAIIESIGEGIIVTDNQGSILMINKVSEELLQIKEQEAIGKKPSDVFNIFDKQDKLLGVNERPIFIALQTNSKVVKEVYVVHETGKRVELGVIASPIVRKNVIIGAIEVIRDITFEKEVDRMKTEFISLASHQLRTPLSAIKWYSEMLTNADAGPLNADQLDFAKNIGFSADRMAAIINSLLNISRIESGRVMIAPASVNLKELVSEVISVLSTKFADRKQNIVLSVGENLPNVNVDLRLTRHIYTNLLTNAIKYSPKGSQIVVSIFQKDNMIVSQITDHGFGIPKSVQSRVFQKFFRADNVAKTETDGTGLGLYFAKIIADYSQGKIWFESDEGKGTTFWFALPSSGMEPRKGEVTLE